MLESRDGGSEGLVVGFRRRMMWNRRGGAYCRVGGSGEVAAGDEWRVEAAGIGLAGAEEAEARGMGLEE